MDTYDPTTSAKPTQPSRASFLRKQSGKPCIPVSKETVQICGGHLGSAIVLTQLLFWAKSRQSEEWFFQSMENLSGQLGFNRKRVYRAREKLVRLGFISQQFVGMPRRVKVVIHHDRVEEAKDTAPGKQMSLFTPTEPPQISVDMSAFYPVSHGTECPTVGDTVSLIYGTECPTVGDTVSQYKEEIPLRDSKDSVKEIPSAAQSAASSDPPKPHRKKAEKEPLHFDLTRFNPEFVETWEEWVEYRMAMKRPPVSWQKLFDKQLEMLSEHPRDAVMMLKQSMCNGWQGIFEVKGGGKQKQNVQDAVEGAMRILREDRQKKENENGHRGNGNPFYPGFRDTSNDDRGGGQAGTAGGLLQAAS